MRPQKILELSDNGYEILGIEKDKIPTRYGKLEHRLKISEIAKILEGSGWNVEKKLRKELI